jgi:hypothetical protein
MRVRRYRPAFFSGFDDEEAPADTVEELLAIPWVHSWTEDENFHRLSVVDGMLMAELNGGRTWWVIAMFDELGTFGLPAWEAVRR